MNFGIFITLEGTEGVGKTSALDFVLKVLESLGKKAIVTREPGGTTLGEKIRHLLLDKDSSIVANAELLLLFAARSQHVERVILPNLEQGICVVSDRFTDATMAYQAGGRNMKEEVIEILANLVHPGLVPDLTLLLDAPLNVSEQRLSKRGQSKDRFESENRQFFSKVRQKYLQLADENPSRFVKIDATASQSEVLQQIERTIKERVE